MFLGKGVLKIWSSFTGEHPCRSVISKNLLCNFIETTFRHWCFAVNLLHIFRKRFLKNTSGRLLSDIALTKDFEHWQDWQLSICLQQALDIKEPLEKMENSLLYQEFGISKNLKIVFSPITRSLLETQRESRWRRKTTFLVEWIVKTKNILQPKTSVMWDYCFFFVSDISCNFSTSDPFSLRHLERVNMTVKLRKLDESHLFLVVTFLIYVLFLTSIIVFRYIWRIKLRLSHWTYTDFLETVDQSFL